MRAITYLILMVMTSISGLAINISQNLCTEDLIWEYYSMDQFHSVLEKYCFRGTEYVGNKQYNKLVLTQRISWTEDVGDIVSEELEETKALLRQEEDKVYIVLRDEYIREFDSETKVLSAPYVPDTPVEAVLYDFGAKPGDKYRGVVSVKWGPGSGYLTQNVLTECRVNSVDSVESCGETFPRYTIVSELQESAVKSPEDCWKMLEGWYDGEIIMHESSAGEPSHMWPDQTEIRYVGGIGTLTGEMMSLLPVEPVFLTSCMGYQQSILNNVYDVSGEIIYAGAGYKAPDPGAVEGISSEIGKESPIFDLTGRRIAKPLPGSVYIRDGKKYVGK